MFKSAVSLLLSSKTLLHFKHQLLSTWSHNALHAYWNLVGEKNICYEILCYNFYISKTIFSNNIFLSNSSFLHFALCLANCELMTNLYLGLYPVFLRLYIFPKREKENSLINT